MAEGRREAALPSAAERHHAAQAQVVPRLPKSDFADEWLGAALAFVYEQQDNRPVKRSTSAPSRSGQANHMFGTM